MVTKRLICLANARKPGGRCVAGRELLANGSVGPWVRLLSGRGSQSLTPLETYADGREAKVGDIIEVGVVGPHPNRPPYQTENWLVAPEHRWVKIGDSDMDLREIVAQDTSQQGRRLWIDKDDDDPLEDLREMAPDASEETLEGLELLARRPRGHNDRMWIVQMNRIPIRSSLRLVFVRDLRLAVFDIPRGRRVQARFSLFGSNYRLSVTDPRCEEVYRRMPDKVYRIGSRYLTLSLGAPFREKACYKLVAAVIKE